MLGQPALNWEQPSVLNGHYRRKGQGQNSVPESASLQIWVCQYCTMHPLLKRPRRKGHTGDHGRAPSSLPVFMFTSPGQPRRGAKKKNVSCPGMDTSMLVGTEKEGKFRDRHSSLVTASNCDILFMKPSTRRKEDVYTTSETERTCSQISHSMMGLDPTSEGHKQGVHTSSYVDGPAPGSLPNISTSPAPQADPFSLSKVVRKGVVSS